MNLDELRRKAKDVLPAHVHEAIARGVGDSLAYEANIQSWRNIKLAPRVLAGARVATTATSVLGASVTTPLRVAPAGLPRKAHPEGEAAAAKGACAAGTLMVLSHFATRTLEEVAAAAPGCPRWFQLYITKDRGYCGELLQRARTAEYRAIVLTVDSGGGIALEGGQRDPEWDLQPMRGDGVFDVSISLDDIAWVKHVSHLPVAVKGVLRADDARRCLDAGADALVVSNHGGRALDSSVATADALPLIADTLRGDIDVYVDGGIRSGQDVIKAFALGAKAVFIGQPWVWAVCAGGSDAVATVVRNFTAELVAGLAMCGISSLDAIDSQVLWSEIRRGHE
jgi:4-hydroxymandelate oxidase